MRLEAEDQPPQPPAADARPGRAPLWYALLRGSLVAGTTAALLASVLGLLLRDRVALLAALTYAPVPFVAAAGVALDACVRGRAWRRPRFGLTAACAAVAAWHAAGMTGWRVAAPPPADAPAFRVLQWNVRWGGSPRGVTEAWPATVAAIAEASPDLVVLSEAPPRKHLAALPAALGEAWSVVSIQHPPGAAYWYRVAVAAPHPVAFVRRWPLADGVGAEFVVDRPDGRVRVLVVDAPSAPWRDRWPILAALLQLTRDAAEAGDPFDLLAGDFNAPSRSVGFDPFPAAGFTNAAAFAGWRGTWRMPLPWLDLDHIWVRDATARVVSCRLFAGPRPLDHRGIVCDVVRSPRP